MSANQFDINFVADTTGAVTAIQALNAELKAVAKTAYSTDMSFSRANSAMTNMAAQTGLVSAAVKDLGTNLNLTSSHTEGMGAALLGLNAGVQIFSMLIPLATQFGDKVAQHRQHMEKLTQDAEKLLDTWREIAHLQGKDAPDAEVAASVLKDGMASGLMPQEARQFEQHFLGSINAGLDKGNITKETAQELKGIGQIFGTRYNIEMATMGNLTGVMGQYQKVPDAQAGAQTMGRIAWALDHGMGDMEPLTRTLINTAGSLVGEAGSPMESLEELAVMESVASTHANPYATGTRLRQAVRALRETKGPHGKWLADHGVQDGMTHRERLKAIKPHIMEEAINGKGVDQVLKEHVTDDDTEARSLAEQLGDTKLMDKWHADMQQITGQDVLAGNQTWLKSENGQIRTANAEKAASDYIKGQKGIARDKAMQRAGIRLQDQFTGGWNTAKSWLYLITQATPITGQMGYEDRLKLEGATQDLIEEARAQGMTEPEIFGADGLQMRGTFEQAHLNNPDPHESLETKRKKNSHWYGQQWAHQWDSESIEQYDRLAEQVRRRGGQIHGKSQAEQLGAKLDEKARDQNAAPGQPRTEAEELLWQRDPAPSGWGEWAWDQVGALTGSDMSYRDRSKVNQATGQLIGHMQEAGITEEEIYGKDGLNLKEKYGVTPNPNGHGDDRRVANIGLLNSARQSSSGADLKADYDRLAQLARTRNVSPAMVNYQVDEAHRDQVDRQDQLARRAPSTIRLAALTQDTVITSEAGGVSGRLGRAPASQGASNGFDAFNQRSWVGNAPGADNGANNPSLNTQKVEQKLDTLIDLTRQSVQQKTSQPQPIGVRPPVTNFNRGLTGAIQPRRP